MRDECGSVLLLAIVVLLVLMIAVSTTIGLGSSGSRAASRTNAGQRAYSIAESGVNNAVAVLFANYPGTVTYPGDPNLLPTRTTTYSGGTAQWSGALQHVTGQPWRWQWLITSVGTVASPIGGTSAVTRTAQAVVPVVIPTTQQVNGLDTLNWLYAGHDLTLGQTINVGSPIFVNNNFTLQNQASVLAAAKTVVVGGNPDVGGGNLKTGNSQSSVGTSAARIANVHVAGKCNSSTCSTPSWESHSVYATAADNSIPSGLLTVPALTCCAPVAGSIAPAGSLTTSVMGFWYQNADIGPNSACDPATKTGTPPAFDTADNTINGSAYSANAPFDLTPSSSYTCREVINGQTFGELSWDNAKSTLTVKGTIFIDGSATVSSGNARYKGSATLMLSGVFTMGNSGKQLCAVVSTPGCDMSATTTWDPNTNYLAIVADGDDGSGNGISLKGSDFQGALEANGNIVTDTHTTVQGPMVSVYHDVTGGENGTYSFPPIARAPSGGGGSTAPPPLGQLLTPQDFQ